MNYSNLTNLNCNAGIYIRLSQEDRGKSYEADSESVANQRDELTNFVKKNGFTLVNEYVDDGYSGTTFNRPSFENLLKDIKDKKIDIVIVKDLSRLGRDHVMTGYYMETFFPENKVRFISILENYDSMKKQASNDSSTFIIACNDYYSKQNSVKIRSVLDAKRKDGKFIGSTPCYGYMRDPEDKGHLVPDPNVCDYVTMMFEWRANDIGISEIATKLNEINAPTPSSYKNLPYSSRLKDSKTWAISSVKKILQNEMYTGTMVQHTQTKVSYKSEKKVTLDESLWIKVEGTHEPLVDREIFRIVNQKRRNNERTTKLRSNRPIRLLEGFLYCKECDNRLGVSYRKHKDYWSVNCNKYARDPIRNKCTPHFFPYEYLEMQILNELKNLLSKLFSYINVNDLNSEIINRHELNHSSLEDIKIKCQKEHDKISKTISTIYQDRIDGAITIEQYKLLVKPYEEKIKDINNNIENIEIEIIKKKQSTNKIPDYTNNIKKLLNVNEPKKELLKTLVEKIIIDDVRNITIKFKYELLEEHTFKYIECSKPRNPYGRKGKVII